MSLQDGLTKLVAAAIEERGKSSDGLTETTSLLRSGLLDSLALLQIGIWIEEESGTRIDMRGLDLRQEWDCIRDICRFVEAQKGE